MGLQDGRVACTMNNYFYYDSKLTYPTVAPYNPSENYPEYPFNIACDSYERNEVYSAIRQMLIGLGFDKENIGNLHGIHWVNSLFQGKRY